MKSSRKDGRERILVVEDEALLRWSIQRFLQSRGYVVSVAADSSAALEVLLAGPVDLLVTDLGLKGITGLDLAARARESNPRTQVIIITGSSTKEDILKALRQGVWDYVEKPFDLEMLLISVEKALEKTRMEKELVRLSRTDGLTGLFNQRHFYKTLETEMRRAERQGRPLSLILIDVDDFKKLNDSRGHIEGDMVLVQIAACISRACRRDVDTAFRYGGDEFVVVLPDASREAAERVAGRICSLLETEAPGVTLSLGVTELRERTDLTAAVKEADDAMYLAKQFGGNRTVTFNKTG